MAKIDAQRRADVTPPVANGELVPVASVVQITHLTVAGPYEGDFQIVNSGRLIVGEYVDVGARVVISQDGLRGWNNNNVNTFSLWTRTVVDPNGTTHAPGDMHLGNMAANYLQYNQTTGTLGLYTPQGAGFIAQRDGTLQAGHATGAHMLWDASQERLQIRRGTDVKAQIDANGDAWFDGTIYANGGRIYGTMAVDDVLRAGDVDGPAVYLGKFTRDTATGTVETSEIIATDESNMPWFHVVAGGEVLTGYFHLGGTGNYAQQLNYDGTTLSMDGTIRAASGTIGGWTIGATALSSTNNAVTLNSSGTITWANGKGSADVDGLRHIESVTSSWKVEPNSNEFMRIDTTGAETGIGMAVVNTGTGDGIQTTAVSGRGIYGAATTGQGVHGLASGAAGVGVMAEAINLATLALTASGVTRLGDGGTTDYSQFSSSGVLTFAGSAYAVPRYAVRTETANYVATDNDSVIVCNKATAMTVTLSAATGRGKWYAIASIGAGIVTVDGAGSDTISGTANIALNQYDTAQIVDYASGKWIVI